MLRIFCYNYQCRNFYHNFLTYFSLGRNFCTPKILFDIMILQRLADPLKKDLDRLEAYSLLYVHSKFSRSYPSSRITQLLVLLGPQAEISTTQHIFQGRYIVEVSRLYKKYLINPQGQIRPKNRFPVVISPSDTFSHCHAQPFSNWNSGVLGKSAN